MTHPRSPAQVGSTHREHDHPWLWVVFTLLAAAGQTARNAMQRELTASLGTVGATHVRFLFGFPFALLFLVGVVLVERRGAAAAAGWSSGRGCWSARWRRSPRPR